MNLLSDSYTPMDSMVPENEQVELLVLPAAVNPWMIKLPKPVARELRGELPTY